MQSVHLEALDEEELCRFVGLNPKTLQQDFGKIFQKTLEVFNFFQNGDIQNHVGSSDQNLECKNVTKPNTTATMSDKHFQANKITADSNDKQQVPNIKTMIHMIIHLYEKLNNSLAFSKNTLIRVPYNFDIK